MANILEIIQRFRSEGAEQAINEQNRVRQAATNTQTAQSAQATRLREELRRVGGDLSRVNSAYVETGQVAENAAQRAGRATQQWSFLNNSLLRNIYKLRWEIVSITFFVYAFARAIDAIGAAVYEGTRFNEQISALDRLGVAYQSNSSKIIASLEESSKGTIEQAKLTTIAGKALIMGITEDTLADLMKISTAAARATGETTEKMFADITLGTARSSKKILDNIGIIVDWRAAYASHAAEIGKTVNSLTEEEKAVARINEIKRKGGAIVRDLNSDYSTQRERIDALSASFANLGTKAKQALADIFFPPTKEEVATKKVREIEATIKRLEESKGLDVNFFAGAGVDVRIAALKEELARYAPLAKAEETRILRQKAINDLSKDFATTLERTGTIHDKFIKIDKVATLKKEYDNLSITLSGLIEKMRAEGTKAPDDMVQSWLISTDKIKMSLNEIATEIDKLERKRLADLAKKRAAATKAAEGAFGIITKEDINRQFEEALSQFRLIATGRGADEVIAARDALFRRLETIVGTAEKEGVTILGFKPEKLKERLQELYVGLIDSTEETTRKLYTKTGELATNMKDAFFVGLQGYIKDTETLISETDEAINVLIGQNEVKATSTFDYMYNELQTYRDRYIQTEEEITAAFEGELDYRLSAFRRWLPQIAVPVETNIPTANVAGAISGSESDLPFFVEETYGRGGIAKKPTVALVGEEEPEYIIPESKMQQFLTNNAFTVNYYGGESRSRVQDEFELRRLFAGMQSNARISY